MGDVSAALNQDNLEIINSPVSASMLASLLTRIEDGTISGKIAKELFQTLWSGEKNVDDLIEGMTGIMEQKESVGPVNLGNPNEFTIRQLAEAVLGRIVTTSKIVEKPLPADDPTQRKPDITLAQKLISWEPKVQLTDGLDRTIPYFREIIKA